MPDESLEAQLDRVRRDIHAARGPVFNAFMADGRDGTTHEGMAALLEEEQAAMAPLVAEASRLLLALRASGTDRVAAWVRRHIAALETARASSACPPWLAPDVDDQIERWRALLRGEVDVVLPDNRLESHLYVIT